MSNEKKERKIRYHTEQMAGEFLFDVRDFDEYQGLDMRTRVKSPAMMNAIMFYGILHESLGCKSAGTIKSMLERLLISHGGEGRKEGVEVLRQQLPKIRELRIGTDRRDLEEYQPEE